MRRDKASGLQPGLGGEPLGEVSHNRLNFGLVDKGGKAVAGAEYGLTLFLVDRGKVEVVDILADVGVVRQKGGDEARLTMHERLRGILYQRSRRIAEGYGEDAVASSEHVVLVEPYVGHDLAGTLDLGRVEGELAGYPLVVFLGGGGSQHYVLQPVGGDPAGCAGALHTDGPRRVAVFDHLVAELEHLVPGFGYLIALFLEYRLGIPHEALYAGAVPDSDHLSLVGSEIEPALVVLLLQVVFLEPVVEVDVVYTGHDVLHEAGLRKGGDVGGISTLCPHGNEGLEVA